MRLAIVHLSKFSSNFYSVCCCHNKNMLLRRVICSRFSRLSHNGTRFWSAVAVPELVDSITTVTDGEIDPVVVDETLKLNPKLLDYNLKSWEKVLATFRNQGFPSYMLLPLVVNHPTVLRRSPEQITLGLDKWNTSQFGERNIMKLITKYPKLLEIPNDETSISNRIAHLQTYAETRKNVWTLFMATPSLVTDKLHVIDPKIKYLQGKMGVNLSEVLKSEVFSSSLLKIRTRHVFLERLGMYKAKGYKEDPGKVNNNPKLYQIVDTSDKTFATKVAFATLEEFEVFEELYARELNEEDEEHDASDSDE